jgi:hypothetical protein
MASAQVAFIPVPLRNALFALALALQAFAGGAAVAAAAAGANGISANCEHVETLPSGAPTGHADHHCGACALCAAQHSPDTATTTFFAVLPTPPGQAVGARRPLPVDLSERALHARAHQARAPPAA